MGKPRKNYFKPSKKIDGIHSSRDLFFYNNLWEVNDLIDKGLAEEDTSSWYPHYDIINHEVDDLIDKGLEEDDAMKQAFDNMVNCKIETWLFAMLDHSNKFKNSPGKTLQKKRRNWIESIVGKFNLLGQKHYEIIKNLEPITGQLNNLKNILQSAEKLFPEVFTCTEENEGDGAKQEIQIIETAVTDLERIIKNLSTDHIQTDILFGNAQIVAEDYIGNYWDVGKKRTVEYPSLEALVYQLHAMGLPRNNAWKRVDQINRQFTPTRPLDLISTDDQEELFLNYWKRTILKSKRWDEIVRTQGGID